MQDTIFDISFVFDGKKYKGSVTPSEKLNDKGVPVSFYIELNNSSFGDLTFQNCIWTVNQERPAALVKQIGKQIEKHYQF